MIRACPRPSKDKRGRSSSPQKGPFGPLRGCGVGYASAFGANRTRAASATSGAMPHVVFFASPGRAWLARSQPLRRFGSMPSSSARALGVSVVGVESGMLAPFVLGARRASGAASRSYSKHDTRGAVNDA